MRRVRDARRLHPRLTQEKCSACWTRTRYPSAPGATFTRDASHEMRQASRHAHVQIPRAMPSSLAVRTQRHFCIHTACTKHRVLVQEIKRYVTSNDPASNGVRRGGTRGVPCEPGLTHSAL